MMYLDPTHFHSIQLSPFFTGALNPRSTRTSSSPICTYRARPLLILCWSYFPKSDASPRLASLLALSPQTEASRGLNFDLCLVSMRVGCDMLACTTHRRRRSPVFHYYQLLYPYYSIPIRDFRPSQFPDLVYFSCFPCVAHASGLRADLFQMTMLYIFRLTNVINARTSMSNTVTICVRIRHPTREPRTSQAPKKSQESQFQRIRPPSSILKTAKKKKTERTCQKKTT